MTKGGFKIKRKVIQIADSTQLVSLPRKWALKHNIKKGDELEIIDQGRRLLIETTGDKETETRRKSVNLDGMEPYLKYILTSLYQKGYGEVTLKYSDEKTANSLNKILYEEMIGFEVVEQKTNSSTIRSIAGALPSEFDTMLLRAYQIVVTMLDGIVGVLKSGNLLAIKSLTYMEVNNRKYAAFCKRMINMRVVNDENITYLYIIVVRLERLARHLKYLCYEMMKLPNEVKSLEKELFEMYNELNRMLKKSFELYNDFDMMKTLELFDRKQKIVDRGHEFLRNNQGPQIRFIHYVFNISQGIQELARAKMQMRL